MKLNTPLYRRKKTEAELQADLYAALKNFGLDARMEMFGYIPVNYNVNGRRRCIFDIVVFWPLNHKPICIIECKRGLSITRDNKQIERYKQFGVPLLILFRNNHESIFNQVVELARSDFKNAPPSMRKAVAFTRTTSC